MEWPVLVHPFNASNCFASHCDMASRITTLFVLATLALLVSISAAPTLHPALHGRLVHHSTTHESQLRALQRHSTPPSGEQIHLAIHLRAHDQRKVDRVLDDIHNPNHPSFRKFLTADEAHALVA